MRSFPHTSSSNSSPKRCRKREESGCLSKTHLDRCTVINIAFCIYYNTYAQRSRLGLLHDFVIHNIIIILLELLLTTTVRSTVQTQTATWQMPKPCHHNLAYHQVSEIRQRSGSNCVLVTFSGLKRQTKSNSRLPNSMSNLNQNNYNLCYLQLSKSTKATEPEKA